VGLKRGIQKKAEENNGRVEMDDQQENGDTLGENVAGILDTQFVSVSITKQGFHVYRNRVYELRRTNRKT
jgi:hypothetical protein